MKVGPVHVIRHATFRRLHQMQDLWGRFSGLITAAGRAAESARAATGDRAWALGPNCSIPTTSRDANIRAAGRVIRAL